MFTCITLLKNEYSIKTMVHVLYTNLFISPVDFNLLQLLKGDKKRGVAGGSVYVIYLTNVDRHIVLYTF